METKKNFIVGIITFFLLVGTGSLIIWQTDIFQKISGYYVIGRFEQIGGLIKGADIRYRGFSVGRVNDITPGPKHIDVRFWVEGDIRITQGSAVKIMFDGLVGENYISIEPNPISKTYVENNAVLIGQSGSDLANFIDLGSQNLIHTEKILSTLRDLLTDKSLNNSVSTTIRNFEKISTQLNILLQDTDESDINRILEDIKSITQSSQHFINELNDPAFIQAIKTIAANMSDVSQSSKNILSQNNSTNINHILQNMSEITDDINILLGEHRDNRPHILSTISSLSLGNQTAVYQNSDTSSGYFDSLFEIGLGKYSLISGVGNKSGETKMEHFQQAYYMTPQLRSRVGVIYNEAGVGVDYHLTQRFLVGANYYNFANGYYNVLGSLLVYPHINIQMIYRNDYDNDETGVDWGIRYDF